METEDTKEPSEVTKEPLKVKKRGRGRPKKSEMPSNQKRPVGRPKGTQAIINEYRDRMLASPKSTRVLEAIFDAALDPEHKNQSAAWKLIIDRIAPTSAFEQEITKGGGTNAINIKIETIGAPNVTVGDEEEPLDAEFTPVEPNE